MQSEQAIQGKQGTELNKGIQEPRLSTWDFEEPLSFLTTIQNWLSSTLSSFKTKQKRDKEHTPKHIKSKTGMLHTPAL